MKLEDAIKKTKLTECCCTEGEYGWIYETISSIVPVGGDGFKYSIEIGSHSGGSSTMIVAASEEKGWHTFCLDTWATGIREKHVGVDNIKDVRGPMWRDKLSLLQAWIKQMKRCGFYDTDLVTPVIGDSAKTSRRITRDGVCCFAWVDGGHEHPQPLHDISGVLLHKPIIIAVHDEDSKDVRAAIEERLVTNPDYIEIEKHERIRAFKYKA